MVYVFTLAFRGFYRRLKFLGRSSVVPGAKGSHCPIWQLADVTNGDGVTPIRGVDRNVG